MNNLLALIALLISAPQDEVTLLRWGGPPGTRPGTFREWIAEHPYKDFHVALRKRSDSYDREQTVAIITEQQLAFYLTDEIDQLMSNLQQEGYTVLSYDMSGGTPEDLRSFLQILYDTEDLQGALFIGELPIAWYQIEDDFNEYGYAEWPIDLFYMDLDGLWRDELRYYNGDLLPGQDSIYDSHSGDVAPEIYVGRLITTGIGDEIQLIRNYLQKDNDYRYNSIALQRRALAYVDDDWYYWAPGYANDIFQLYDDVLLVSDSNTTRASDYRVRLDTVRAWVSVFAHSWPGGHVFYYNNHSNYDYYWSSEYTTQDPPSNFYNHFACSFARYTENGYGGGRAIFNQTYGLGAIGSTKTGSMLSFYYFYHPLSEEKTLGEAFRDWFIHIAQGGFSFNELCWHYGMTLLGDPFLKPTGHYLESTVCTLRVVDAAALPNSSCNRIDLNLYNPTTVEVISFILKFDGSLVSIDSIVPTLRTNFMGLHYDSWSDSLYLTMSSLMSRDSLPPGDGEILELFFNVDSTAVMGDSTILRLDDCEITGGNPDTISYVTRDGWIYFFPIPLPPTLTSPDSGALVSENTPVFRWSNVDYATHHWLQVDLDTLFNSSLINDSLIIAHLYITSNPLPDSQYYWRVCAGDRFKNWSDWSNYFTLTIDTRAPVIESTTVWHDTLYYGPFSVFTYVRDKNGVGSVLLYYRTSLETDWQYLEMNSVGENYYSAEIPEQDSLYIDISYYIMADDVVDPPNESTDPPCAPDSCYEFSTGITGVSDDNPPSSFFLGRNYPNPFTDKTQIKFGLAKGTNVRIDIYDIMGTRVTKLVDGYFDEGNHSVEWQGLNSSGEKIPTGIYFYRMEADGFVATQKLFILR